MVRKCFLWLLLVIYSMAATAQQHTAVGGTVVSDDTGQVLAGATVVGGGQTVVTNDDGYFLLKSDTELTSLTVSHLGYRSQTVRLNISSPDKLRIRLRPIAIQLQELVVVPNDARDLVSAAIHKISKNYSQQPELYQCFYRETAMKRQHYVMVAEGIIDMYKTGYKRMVGRDRVAIRKGRRLLSPKQGDTLGIKVMGGPMAPIQLDVAKNLDFLLNEEELNNYELKLENPTSIADRQQFVVSLEPRQIMPYALYHGCLYIDCETLAFSRAELTLDMTDRDKATRLMLVKKPAGVRFKPKELSLLIDYRHEDGMTRISYVRTTFRFNCDWKRRLFATSYAAFCEMAVTSYTGKDVKPISGRDSFDQRDAFFDQVDFFRDPTFWQDYNIIEPTETLDKAIDRLLKKTLE